jgi:hypothetical protein
MASMQTWSRLVRFVAEDGKTYCGQPVDENVDGTSISPPSTHKLVAHVLSWPCFRGWRVNSRSGEELRFGP